MILVFFACLSAFSTTLVAIFLLKQIAPGINLLDQPNTHRKKHVGAVPLVGGIAVYCGIAVASILFSTIDLSLFVWLTAAGILVVVGVVDDLNALSVKIRLSMQIGVSLLLIVGTGTAIESLGDLFGFGEVRLGVFAVPFTVISIVGVINAFNMIDGIDGLAGGVTLTALLALVFLGTSVSPADVQFLLVVSAAIVAFLVFNLEIFGKPRKVFLGDAGSTLAGFTVVWMLIKMSQSEAGTAPLAPAAALWVIALPLFDMWAVMGMRIARKRSPFSCGRDHLHHLLLGVNLSPRLALIDMLVIGGGFATVACLSQQWRFSDANLFYAFAIVFALYVSVFRGALTGNGALRLMPLSRSRRSLRLKNSA